MIFRPKMPLALIIASCMFLASFISFSNPPSAQANYRADSINTRNNEGNTPLNVATKRADVEAVRSLLHSGADPNVRDNEGNTPLPHCIRQPR
jgi:ankyrin repeat protein